MGSIVNVRELVQLRRQKIKNAVDKLRENNIVPNICVVLVGENPASVSYVTGKEQTAAELGIKLEVKKFQDTLTENELVKEIQLLNNDECVHGFIVQLPLPKHIDEDKIIEVIEPAKDIDGFHPIHLGEMMLGLPTLVSCTPKAVLAILKDLHVPLAGKHVVVVGRSNIVGKPVALLALNENATVSICHSHTKDLQTMTKMADILIVAVGIPHFIGVEDIKKGAVVIDVGVNRSKESKKLVGDVDTNAVQNVVKYVTPVPGGVGPMTITMLLQNSIEAVCAQHSIPFATIFDNEEE